MESSTISAKFQVVIPKNVRKKLNVVPGRKAYFVLTEDGKVELNTDSAVDKVYGSMKGAWGEDSDKYIRESREEADRDRT